jgi:hypothetical protein
MTAVSITATPCASRVASGILGGRPSRAQSQGLSGGLPASSPGKRQGRPRPLLDVAPRPHPLAAYPGDGWREGRVLDVPPGAPTRDAEQRGDLRRADEIRHGPGG